MIRKPAFYHLNVLLAIFFLLAAASCHSGPKHGSGASATPPTAVQLAVSRIDSLHEKAMNTIGPLRRVEDSVRDKIKAAPAGSDTAVLSRLAGALNGCDTAMFGWMGRYDTGLKGKTDSEKVAYLHDQWGKLGRLDKTMDSTMSQARMQL
jgi:hypothetical protein